MCPKCGQALIIAEFEGVEVDCCTECHGSWLDAGELHWIADLAGVRPGRISAALEALVGKPNPGRRCPRCNKTLRAVTIEAENPVELDRCPRGHGLWFDAGELQQVIAMFHDGEEGHVADLLAELHQGELGSHAKGD